MRRAIRGIALQNAYEHDGKTRNDAVISKLLGSRPDLRSKVKEIIPLIDRKSTRLNSSHIQKSRMPSSA